MKIEELRNKDGGLAERQVAWSEIREKEAGLELFHARFMSCSEKKLSEKVWQFGENAYLCTRKTEINAVEPK